MSPGGDALRGHPVGNRVEIDLAHETEDERITEGIEAVTVRTRAKRR